MNEVAALRILRIYPFLPPLPGGMEKHIRRLSEEQRRLGCDVRMVLNRGEVTSAEDLVVLRCLNLRRVRPQVLRDVIFYVGVMVTIAARRIRADVVHVHGDWSAFALGKPVAALAGARKRFATVHSAVRRGRWWRQLYLLTLRGYSLVYATGAAEAKYLTDNSLVVRWQSSGVDAGFFEDAPEPEERTIDVVTVASFVRVKNLLLVIDIARHMPDRSFVLVGDGPEREALAAATKGLSNVSFTGRLSSREVGEVLRRSRVLLSTSFVEGTPTATLEAMACGVAVVTSKSNDFEDLIREGLNGHVVDGFEASKYAEALRKLLGDEARLREISARNRLEASRHRWSDVGSRVTEWMARA